MNIRCSTFSVLLVLLAAATTPAAQAAPPAGINSLVSKSNINAQDRSRIKDWAEYWSDELANARPQEVRGAGQRLMAPLRGPVVVSGIFRLVYTDAALPGLEAIVAKGNPLTVYNAMHVIGALGTPAALNVLLDHCDVADEEDFGTRLWAAKCIPISIEQGALGQNEVNRALRRVGMAAGRETNWLILRRQFEAVGSVQSNVSREVLITILTKTTDRMSDQAGPSDLMDAAFPALKLIRDGWLALPPVEQRTFGADLAPVLSDVCAVARTHWDQAQDSNYKDAYGGAVNISENLLTLIAAQQAGAALGPQTAMSRAWKTGDRDRFADDHEKWKVVLSRPPYKKR